MRENLTAEAAVNVDAERREVWKALIDPEAIKEYMFGAEVISEWREGGPIVWKGEMKGKPYEDKGTILTFDPERTLRYSHFSPLSGQADSPENYHTVTISLADDGDQTRVSLTQDNNPNEEAREHSEKNWAQMLAGLKKYVER